MAKAKNTSKKSASKDQIGKISYMVDQELNKLNGDQAYNIIERPASFQAMVAHMLVEFLSIMTEIVRVVIDCAASFEARRASMRIDWYFDSDFNQQNFPISIRGRETFELRLVNTLKEEEEAVKNGWERAKAEHLMAYAANGWDGKTWVIARGSPWRSPQGILVFPVLRALGSKRGLFLSRFDGRWKGSRHFLVARKCA